MSNQITESNKCFSFDTNTLSLTQISLGVKCLITEMFGEDQTVKPPSLGGTEVFTMLSKIQECEYGGNQFRNADANSLYCIYFLILLQYLPNKHTHAASCDICAFYVDLKVYTNNVKHEINLHETCQKPPHSVFCVGH